MMRRHATWYTKGFRGSAALRAALTRVKTLADLDTELATVDADMPFPPASMRVRRGKPSGTQRVSLPEGYLDDLEDDTPPCAEAIEAVSGG